MDRMGDTAADEEEILTNGKCIETVVIEQIREEITVSTVSYRHKMIHTICVCSSLLALGWRNSMIGPTLPDLKLIINEDLSTTSWIFTAKSFGGLFGSLCGGFAYDRFNKIGVLTILVVLMAVSAGLVPICTNIVAMCVVHIAHGASGAGLDAAATADIALVWRHGAGPYIQALHTAFSVGTIISPFVCEPFLAKKTNTHEHNHLVNASSQATYGSQEIDENNIAQNETNADNNTFVSENINGTDYDHFNKDGKTNIHIPYLIAMGVCLLVSISIIASRLKYGDVYRTSPMETAENSDFSGVKKRYFLSYRLKTFFTVFLCVAISLSVIAEYCFAGFLMTFVTTKLEWASASGSNVTSAFWIAFALGRVTGTLTVKLFRLSAVLIGFITICNIGSILFWVSVAYDIDILTWISTALIGYGLSVMFPTIFSWMSENIRILTGKMCSVLMVAMNIGTMTVPRLVGYLMDKRSQSWFIYSIVLLFIVMFILFIFMLVLYTTLEKRHTSRCVDK
ncbi:hypothetical protein ACF0H5_018204 [Mactra antiquata]